jgi:hypothetical protein
MLEIVNAKWKTWNHTVSESNGDGIDAFTRPMASHAGLKSTILVYGYLY